MDRSDIYSLVVQVFATINIFYNFIFKYGLYAAYSVQ